MRRCRPTIYRCGRGRRPANAIRSAGPLRRHLARSRCPPHVAFAYHTNALAQPYICAHHNASSVDVESSAASRVPNGMGAVGYETRAVIPNVAVTQCLPLPVSRVAETEGADAAIISNKDRAVRTDCKPVSDVRTLSPEHVQPTSSRKLIVGISTPSPITTI